MTITDQLNAYAGDNIWQDIILTLDSYDEVATDQIDEGKNDRFVLDDGTVVEYAAETGQWQARRRPGRPEVGKPVHVRLGDLIILVDSYAAARDMTRADAIRDLVQKGLQAENLAASGPAPVATAQAACGTGFLTARLDEDEATAKLVRHEDWFDGDAWIELAGDVSNHAQRHDPARVLREVQAKRETLAAYMACENAMEDDDTRWRAGQVFALRSIIGAMAAIYRDHPDYDPAWA